jgi:hypothetical protein
VIKTDVEAEITIAQPPEPVTWVMLDPAQAVS